MTCGILGLDAFDKKSFISVNVFCRKIPAFFQRMLGILPPLFLFAVLDIVNADGGRACFLNVSLVLRFTPRLTLPRPFGLIHSALSPPPLSYQSYQPFSPFVNRFFRWGWRTAPVVGIGKRRRRWQQRQHIRGASFFGGAAHDGSVARGRRRRRQFGKLFFFPSPLFYQSPLAPT